MSDIYEGIKSFFGLEQESENTGNSSRQPSEAPSPSTGMVGRGAARQSAEAVGTRAARNERAGRAARDALNASLGIKSSRRND